MYTYIYVYMSMYIDIFVGAILGHVSDLSMRREKYTDIFTYI